MTNAIVNFGDRDEIKELSERIQRMMPGGSNYTAKEALTLAQISVAHDLDPFNGECWLIKNENTGKVYGALIGIKGHRKHAKLQSDYWGDFVRVVEVEKYNAPAGSIVYEYHLHDDVTLTKYTERLEKLVAIGYDLEAAQRMVGKAPSTLGVGIYEKGEQTKMKPVQCAMFRAEKDALKRRFDVQFRINIDGQEIPVTTNGDGDDELYTDEIEAEYTEEPRDQDELLEELGYDEPQHTSRPYSPEMVRVKLAKAIDAMPDFEPTDAQRKLLRYALELCFPGDDDAADKRHKIMQYLFDDPSTVNVTGSQFKVIVDKWLEVDKDSGGEYTVNKLARQEAQAIAAL